MVGRGRYLDAQPLQKYPKENQPAGLDALNLRARGK
jgi:hypothetical protein